VEGQGVWCGGTGSVVW